MPWKCSVVAMIITCDALSIQSIRETIHQVSIPCLFLLWYADSRVSYADYEGRARPSMDIRAGT